MTGGPEIRRAQATSALPLAAPPPTARAVPWWVSALDLGTIAFTLAAVYVFYAGGIHTTIAGIPVLIKSPSRALQRAAVLALARHLLYRRPSLPTRLATAFAAMRHAWQRWNERWPVAFTVVSVTLVTRILVLVVGIVAVLAVGYAPGAPPFRVSPSELVNLPVRWDAGWYLGLVVDGYTWPARARGQLNVAFFPAYPWLVRAVGLFQLDRASAPLASWLAVAVSIVLFACALWYVHRLALRVGTRDTAAAAVVLLATFPFAVFFSVPYTESLFLLVTAGAIHHQASREYWRAVAFGLVAGLSRPNGVLLGVPLALMVARHAWSGRGSGGPGRALAAVRDTSSGWLAAAAPALGLLAYSALCWWHTGRPLVWMEVQSVGWNRSSVEFWPVFDEVQRMVLPRVESTWEWTPLDVSNLLAVALAAIAAWPVARRVGPALGVYVAVSLAVPLYYGGLMSTGRFTSVLFPVFIWLGLALGRRASELTALTFMAGQALFAVLFFTWRPLF